MRLVPEASVGELTHGEVVLEPDLDLAQKRPARSFDEKIHAVTLV
jgi:hypothetical protein